MMNKQLTPQQEVDALSKQLSELHSILAPVQSTINLLEGCIMAKYTEWCPECDAETDYDEIKLITCKGCGEILPPCDGCTLSTVPDADGYFNHSSCPFPDKCKFDV